MVSLITPAKAQKRIAEQARARRLQMELTQEGLAERSGVALPTLRKFERTGTLSLESFLKLQMVLYKNMKCIFSKTLKNFDPKSPQI